MNHKKFFSHTPQKHTDIDQKEKINEAQHDFFLSTANLLNITSIYIHNKTHVAETIISPITEAHAAPRAPMEGINITLNKRLKMTPQTVAIKYLDSKEAVVITCIPKNKKSY